MRQGPILNTIPALQDLTLAGGSSVAEPEAQGRLFITAPPNQPHLGQGMCNPTASGCSANTNHRAQGGGGSLRCARPQHMASGNTSHCQHLPTIPPHSAGRGWACWDRDEKLSGQEAENKSGGGIMKLQPRKPTPALGSVREAGVGVRGGGGGDGWGLPAWCAPQAVHPIFRVALIRPRYLAASQSLSVANVQVDWLGLSPRSGGGAVTVTPATWGSLTCSPGWRAVCCSRGCWPPAPASC